MTDETPTPEPEEAKALPTAEPAPVSFWNRPKVEQFLIPLVLPVAVILFVVVYVLNISRMFLSGHEHIPVIVGTVITLIILVGATLLSSAASRVTKSLMTLVAALFVLGITGSGWLLLGHSQGEAAEAASLPPDLKTKVTEEVVAAPGGALAFAPAELEGKTGLVKFDIEVASPGHTFAFKDPATKLGQPVQLEPAGSKVEAIGYFATAGEYEYECTIPGHAAAGMHGTLTVDGDPVPTLEQAITDAGNPAGAGEGG
jgi:plastocyanin